MFMVYIHYSYKGIKENTWISQSEGLEGTIPKTVLGAVFDSFCKLKVFQTISKKY